MTKNALLVLALLLSTIVYSQENREKKEIKNVIELFFDGLHKGDSAIVSNTLHNQIKIQTTGMQSNGNKFLKTETKAQLLTMIASKNPNDNYLEKLLSIEIKIDGNLASVWTPYEFYYNNTFSHCGANSFQLFNNNGKWEIIYLVDMRRRQNCKTTKEKK